MPFLVSLAMPVLVVLVVLLISVQLVRQENSPQMSVVPPASENAPGVTVAKLESTVPLVPLNVSSAPLGKLQ